MKLIFLSFLLTMSSNAFASFCETEIYNEIGVFEYCEGYRHESDFDQCTQSNQKYSTCVDYLESVVSNCDESSERNVWDGNAVLELRSDSKGCKSSRRLLDNCIARQIRKCEADDF